MQIAEPFKFRIQISDLRMPGNGAVRTYQHDLFAVTDADYFETVDGSSDG